MQHPFDGVVHEVFAVPADDFLEGGRVLELRRLVAPDGNGLEVFAPHHGPHTGAAVGVAEVVHHAGIADKVFASRPDAGHPDPRVPEFRTNPALGLAGILAPQVSGVPHLDLAVLDPEVNGR